MKLKISKILREFISRSLHVYCFTELCFSHEQCVGHMCLLACIYHVTMKTSSASGNVLTTYSPAVTMFGVVGSRSTGIKQTATVSSGVRQHAALSVLFAIQTYPYFLYERENVQWAYSQVSVCSALEYAILCYSCVCTFVYKYI